MKDPDEERKQIRREIEIIESNIDVLDSQYIDFFNYRTSEEPKLLRSQTELLAAQWRDKLIYDSVLRFKFRNLLYRYNIHKERWDRALTEKHRNELNI